MKAARWLGVPPWELAKKPIFWVRWANLIEAAEAQAEEFRMKRAFDT